MDEREKLYVELMILPEPESCEAAEFIRQGYLTDKHIYTQKALDYFAEYLDSKKEPVLKAISEVGPGARRGELMKRAGITQFGVLMDVANKLVQEGKLKKENGKYIPLS